MITRAIIDICRICSRTKKTDSFIANGLKVNISVPKTCLYLCTGTATLILSTEPFDMST